MHFSARHGALLILASAPLWADVCDGLPAGPAKNFQRMDEPVTLSHRGRPSGLPVDRYTIQDDRLRVINKEVVDLSGCTLTVSDLVGNSMRVTAVHRFDDKH